MVDGSNGVLIVGEVGEAGLRQVSLELVTAGRDVADALGGPLTALVLGSGVGGAANDVASAGVDRVLVADDARLAGLTCEAATSVVVAAIEQVSPAVVLMPGTTVGRDYAPRVAARLRTGLAADAVKLGVEDGGLVAVRPVLGGRVQAAVRMPESRPQMAAVRPGSHDPAAKGSGSAPGRAAGVRAGAGSVAGTGDRSEPSGSWRGKYHLSRDGRGRWPGIEGAGQVRAGRGAGGGVGRGGGRTRAVVDAGWRPHHEQIGQTGHTVAPKLYIAVGISGAVQHLVGMQGSETIVAINRDPDAPIFKIASFGIVGDLFEVVPALTAELKVKGLGVRGWGLGRMGFRVCFEHVRFCSERPRLRDWRQIRGMCS